MARARTPLLSPVRLRTKNTQQRSSTSVTRHGAASLLEKAQPGPLPTISLCELTLFVVPDTKTKPKQKAPTLPLQTRQVLLPAMTLSTLTFLPTPGSLLHPSILLVSAFLSLRSNCCNSLSSQSRSGSTSHPSRFRGRTRKKNSVLDS